MGKESERETQAELLRETFYVSSAMADSLRQAATRVSGEGILNAAGVLWEIAQKELGETRGSSILRAISTGKTAQVIGSLSTRARELSLGNSCGTILIGDESFAYDYSLAQALEKAPKVNGGRDFTTGDFVLAEAEATGSILLQTLSEAGARLLDLSILRATADLVRVQEEGSVMVENSYRPQVQDEKPYFQKPIEGTLPAQTKYVVDLISEAAGRPAKELSVKGEWVSDLLASVHRQIITVLVCEDLLAQEIIEATVSQLAQTDRSLFNISNIIGIDQVSLQIDPASAIENGIRAANNGVLFLPHASQFLSQNDRLRRVLSSGRMKLITVLSEEEWKKHRSESHFSKLRPLYPPAPTVGEAVKILLAQKEFLQRELSPDGVITISTEAINEACKLARRYLRDAPFLSATKELIARAVSEIMVKHSFSQIGDGRVSSDMQVDPEDIAIAVEKITGNEVFVDRPERYINMEQVLSKRVVHQEEAISSVSEAIRRAKAGFADPNRPIGSFMFMGASGSGKTELAKTLAEFLFGDEKDLIVLDMSEYGERHNVARLVGSPPGYVAYEEGGQLTEAVRKKPYCVVLFDEVEKAHPEVWNILLQILEEGRLTDGQGRTIDFTQTVVIATGNVGSQFFAVEQEVGREKVLGAVQEEIKSTFRPEQLNRFGKIIVFNSLRPEDLLIIVDIQIQKLNKRLSEKGLELELTPAAKQQLARNGYNPIYGARPLRREIDDLTARLAKEVLGGKYKSGDKVRIGVNEGKLTLNKKKVKK